jgi:ABC-2 type transport system permease protein
VAVAGGPERHGREPRAWDFARLKLRLLRNGFRGQTWRVIGFALGILFGLWMAGLAVLGFAASATAPRDVGFVVAAFTGVAVVLGWTLIPLLFFGVDETLDPARFALLPIRRGTLARGMLAAALIGVPAVVTLLATAGLVIAAGIRYGPVEAVTAAVGIVAGLLVGVVASRAVTSQFAALLRSRRVRDLAAVTLAVLASSVAPLQWLIIAVVAEGNLPQAMRVAEILGWTPLAAPYVLPYDVAAGNWLAAGARLAMTVAAIGLLLWWWSRTIEDSMLGTSSGGAAKRAGRVGTGAVAALIPRALSGLARPTQFGAIVARESRYWWRDARRRSSLLSILIASAVVPLVFNFAGSGGPVNGASVEFSTLGFSLAVTLAGAMGGVLLANQFAYDSNAYAAHLLAAVPGRVELRARGAAIALVAIPVQILVVVAVAVVGDSVAQLPAGIGLLGAAFGTAVASSALLSVLAPYALPDSSNPFAVSGGGSSIKGILALVAMLGTFALCLPVTLAAFALADVALGPWLVLLFGAGYGYGAVWLGTLIAGDLLDRRGPEVLAAITPKR